jgi:thioredoxin reductase (NADPH)
VTELEGEGGNLFQRHRQDRDNAITKISCDTILPFFGLTMKLGPVANWGIAVENNLVAIETSAFEPTGPAFSPSAISTPIPASLS